jgi:hypothetical protein
VEVTVVWFNPLQTADAETSRQTKNMANFKYLSKGKIIINRMEINNNQKE